MAPLGFKAIFWYQIRPGILELFWTKSEPTYDQHVTMFVDMHVHKRTCMHLKTLVKNGRIETQQVFLAARGSAIDAGVVPHTCTHEAWPTCG